MYSIAYPKIIKNHVQMSVRSQQQHRSCFVCNRRVPARKAAVNVVQHHRDDSNCTQAIHFVKDGRMNLLCEVFSGDKEEEEGVVFEVGVMESVARCLESTFSSNSPLRRRIGKVDDPFSVKIFFLKRFGLLIK